MAGTARQAEAPRRPEDPGQAQEAPQTQETRQDAEARQAPPAEFAALYDHVVTCGKCGFCQPACPIFRATGREAHVARGKVALYRNIIEGRTDIAPDVKDAFSNCLLCRACTETCFSSVRTDDVVVSFRHVYAERFGRGFLQRRVFRDLLPRPRLMRTLVRSLWALRKTGLPDLVRRAGLVGLLNPKLERAMELGPGTPGPLLSSRLAKRGRRTAEAVSAAGAATGAGGAAEQPAEVGFAAGQAAPRPRVGYWMSCGYNYVLPEVGEATVRVLEHLSDDVEVLDNCCCGLAAYGYGDIEAAQGLARENLRRLGDLDRFDAIVSECGSCSGHLKEYPDLLAGDAEWTGRAAALAAKTRSFSEFVQEQGGLGPLPADAPIGPAVVTYHDPCHLGRRYQNVVDQPRALIRSLPGVTFREAAESDSCCGAAGTYGVLHPESSAAIIERKMGFFGETGATVIATECPSCMMQLAFGAKRAGLDAEVRNVSQLCDQALNARKST